jgi:hypothetical protein
MQIQGRMLGASTTSLREIDLFLARIYHEAPDDVFELVVSKCGEVELGWGRGGLNAFRLANKRCLQVVWLCATRLTYLQVEDEPESLPIPIIGRCRRIEEITFHSDNLRSLEGCPDGLKRLHMNMLVISQTCPHWPLAQ